PTQVAAAIEKGGYTAHPEDVSISPANAEERRLAHQHEQAKGWLRRAVAGVVLWLPLEATHWLLYVTSKGHGEEHAGGTNWMTWAALVASTIAIIYVGSSFYRSAWKAAKLPTSNMDTLIAMGASVAYLYSLV